MIRQKNWKNLQYCYLAVGVPCCGKFFLKKTVTKKLNHSYWVIGSVLGSLLGSSLPLNFAGVEFVLTALFVTMFVEQWLSNKDHAPALIGVMSTAVCLLLFGKQLFLIPSMALIALLLSLDKKTGRRNQDV